VYILLFNSYVTFHFNSNDLLFDVDNKLFACSKSELHCLHHMLPLRSSSSQMTFRPQGHSYDVPRVVYDLTKCSFILQLCVNRNQCYCNF